MVEQKYLFDESKLSGGFAESLLTPSTLEELSQMVQNLWKVDQEITISAARTGITGGAVPFGGTLISLEKMYRPLGIGYDKEQKRWFLRVEPSMTLIEIETLLKEKKITNLMSLTQNSVEKFLSERKSFCYPVDPTEKGASIGGTIATNASGAKSFSYGATRNWVKKLLVVLSSGEILEIERGACKADETGFITVPMVSGVQKISIPSYHYPSVKNSAGIFTAPHMDLIDFFIGSEGILGIIGEVEIWLAEEVDDISVIQFFETEESFLSFVEEIRCRKDIELQFLECIDANGLDLIRKRQESDPSSLEIPKLPKALGGALFFDIKKGETVAQSLQRVQDVSKAVGGNPSFSWVAYSKKDKEKLKKFRHALPETVNEIIFQRKREYPTLHKLSTDMAVANEDLVDIYHYYKKKLAESNLAYVMFGHIGNNHIHINILPQNMDDLEKAKKVYNTLAQKVVSLGGSLSAEHGIGKLKKEYISLMYGDEGVAEMRQIKAFFDPKGLLNKGNVI